MHPIRAIVELALICMFPMLFLLPGMYTGVFLFYIPGLAVAAIIYGTIYDVFTS